jgi:hypothetical protein
MKTIVTMATLFVWLACAGLANSEEAKEPTLYTAYNIWKASKMKCINFKQGTDIIPAGTEVNDVRLWDRSRDSPLYFRTVKDGRKYTIGFTKRWHPKKSMEDYRDMMFTTKNFEALTEGLSEMEIDAIKKGVLVNGMSKRAVLICYGPPPEHYTPKQNASTWYYWANRKDKIEIKFDPDGKLALGDQSSQMDIKKESKSETMASKSQSSSASETQVAAIPKIKEPWTGVLKVEGSMVFGGTWGMKQSGSIVKSTKDSYYEFEGKVSGNQLEGKVRADVDIYFNFVINISSDGQTFIGKTTGGLARLSGPIKGKRK